ncbi:hypothetical protein Fmac_019044 [Flemingia macrophylla]|uniref:Uncharacterized protein n=1 Tax=Flemingia macrophylla TaxID=520843 RepID=A0ABD1M6N3_9FABA
MCLVAEMMVAVIGLWGVFVRPLMFQYAAEMGVVMGGAIYRLMRPERPSSILSNYVPS